MLCSNTKSIQGYTEPIYLMIGLSFGKPVYFVVGMQVGKIPTWVLGCADEIFYNFDSLKDFLSIEFE